MTASVPHTCRFVAHLSPQDFGRMKMNEAKQDQDDWRPGRMKELPEGDEYAIQLPLGPTH